MGNERETIHNVSGPDIDEGVASATREIEQQETLRRRTGVQLTDQAVDEEVTLHKRERKITEENTIADILISPWTRAAVIGGMIFWLVYLALRNNTTVMRGHPESAEETVVVNKDVRIAGEPAQPEGSYVYYGIKFGTARRFEHSEPNTDFSYLNDLTRSKKGYVCPHHPADMPGYPKSKVSMDEDCLYLDVYVPPRKEKHPDQLPVLFWIYGGAFKSGDKNIYDAGLLADAVDAIVVTPSYRLSAFGFLSTGDDIARGNWGVGDLKLALNWTIDNIAAFGGDPTQITVSGQSAGGTFTSALFLDEYVRYNVRAGLALSGSILSDRAMMKNPEVSTKILAGHLKCPNETNAESVDCLKKLPWKKLLEGTKMFEQADNQKSYVMHYAPVIDKLHIPKSPVDILRERALKQRNLSSKNTATFITGYMTEDASLFSLTAEPEILQDGYQNNYTSALNMLAIFIVGSSTENCSLARAEVKAKKAFNFYRVPHSLSSDEALEVYHRIASDLMCGGNSMKESQLYADAPGSNNQMLVTSFDSGYKKLGAFHVLDVIHLFRGKWDRMLEGNVSEPLAKALHGYVRQILYNGKYDGPFFGKKGNYHELTGDAKFENKQADFTLKIQLLDDMIHCESDDSSTLPQHSEVKADRSDGNAGKAELEDNDPPAPLVTRTV